MQCWDSLTSGDLGPLMLKSLGVWGWFTPKNFQGEHFLFSGELIWLICFWVICPWNKFEEKVQCEYALSCWMDPTDQITLSPTPSPQSDHTVIKLSADAGSLWNTVNQASRPQVILKTQPHICLDYSTRKRPQLVHGWNQAIKTFILPISNLLIVDFISGLVKTTIDRVFATKPNRVIIVKSTPRIMKFASSSFPTKKKKNWM